jgi:hypothetical protein
VWVRVYSLVTSREWHLDWFRHGQFPEHPIQFSFRPWTINIIRIPFRHFSTIIIPQPTNGLTLHNLASFFHLYRPSEILYQLIVIILLFFQKSALFVCPFTHHSFSSSFQQYLSAVAFSSSFQTFLWSCVKYDIGEICTFGCCILSSIYLTGSLWRRQSQQSFNTLTPFNFLFLYECYMLA